MCPYPYIGINIQIQNYTLAQLWRNFYSVMGNVLDGAYHTGINFCFGCCLCFSCVGKLNTTAHAALKKYANET